MATDRLAQIQRQFNERAPIYEEKAAWIVDPGLLGAYVEMARISPESEVLDVCCGTGLVGAGFRGRVRRVVGLDLTEGMLERARDRLDACVQGSADHMPFEDETFDLAVIRQALHFVDSPLGVAREMHRVLKPGGQAVVGHRVPYGAADAAWWEKVNLSKQPLLKNILLAEDIRGVVDGAGFVEVTSRDLHVWESIRVWVDSPEARPGSEDVVSLYRSAPPEVAALRGISISEDQIRDRWRWILVSGRKAG